MTAYTLLLLLVSIICLSSSSPQRRPNRPTGQVTRDWCRLPQRPEHGFYFVSQKGDNYQQDPSGTYVPHGWVLKYTCNTGYMLSSNESVTSCNHGSWRKMLDCIKLCEAVFSDTAELTCEYSGWVVPCSKPVWPRTVLTVRCREGYQDQHSGDRGSIECGSDGQWNYPVDHCRPGNQNKGSAFNLAPLGEAFEFSEPLAPAAASSFAQSEPEQDSSSWECGVQAPQEGHVTLIIDGGPTYSGEFPWLAALYVQADSEWTQICGGTLITPKIVLTAAHCLVLGESRLTPREMRVGLGKYFRDYYKEDEHAEFSDVQKLVVPEAYEGRAKGYVLDIGLVYLTRRAPLSSFVMPACYDWDGKMSLRTGDVGHVAGWGTTENGTSSEAILSAELTYITNSLCKQNIKPAYEKYLTYDKFCAGSNEGSQVNNGDSGGGITFVRNNRHFVFGVVSSKISQQTTFSLFTDASHREHHDWVLRERERLERSH